MKNPDEIYKELKPVQWYKDNWNADCPYPTYVDKKYEKLSWFPLYLYHQQKVNLTKVIPKRHKEACTRYLLPPLIN